MEIDITEFFNEADAYDYASSRAERGENAGRETWQNALGEAARKPLLSTEEELDVLRDYMRGFGAWSADEVNGWSADECNALFIQYISGNIRELESLCMGDDGKIDWDEAEKLAREGTIAGNIYRSGDHIFFYLGD